MERILNFRMSGRLLLGIGALELLQGVVREVGAAKAVVVTDAGVVAAGICNRVRSFLRSGGVSFEIFDKVEPDPVGEQPTYIAACRRRGNISQRVLTGCLSINGAQPLASGRKDFQGALRTNSWY
jgi:alcohol dehydrogenase class IV